MKFTAKIKDHEGKEQEIRFKSYLPLETHFALNGLLKQANDDDLRTYIPVCQALLESWSFDGSPANKDDYLVLDAYVITNIGKAILAHLRERRGDDLKN